MNKRFIFNKPIVTVIKGESCDGKEENMDENILPSENVTTHKKAYNSWVLQGKKQRLSKILKPKKNGKTKENDPLAVLCGGVTKAGLPFKNKTKKASGYCHFH
jgi:hypothetical protein